MFTKERLASFRTLGLVRLPYAVPDDVVRRMHDRVWSLVAGGGFDRDDRSSWRPGPVQKLRALKKGESTPEDCPALAEALDAVFTGPRQTAANWGQPLVTFPHGPGEWLLPSSVWHFDHFYSRPGRIDGVNLFLLIDDVEPGGGGDGGRPVFPLAHASTARQAPADREAQRPEQGIPAVTPVASGLEDGFEGSMRRTQPRVHGSRYGHRWDSGPGHRVDGQGRGRILVSPSVLPCPGTQRLESASSDAHAAHLQPVDARDLREPATGEDGDENAGHTEARMSAIGMVSIVLGIVLTCSRAPLLVAPAATLRRVEWLVESDTRLRVLGGIALVLGVLMAWAGATAYGTLASVLFVWGWAMIGFALLALLLFPGWYRGLVGAILPDAVSRDLPGWRLLGLLGTSIGVLMIYAGVAAL